MGHRSVLLGALLLALASCTAEIPGGDSEGSGAAASQGSHDDDPTTVLECKADESPTVTISARIRRLSRLELENTLADLLGEDTRPLVEDLEADTFAIGYSTGEERGISSNYVDTLKSVVERAAKSLQAAPERQALGTECIVDAASSEACARTFIESFGARSLRRPLTSEEVDGLLGVYTAGVTTVAAGDPSAALNAGLDYAVRAMLQSPTFVFRTELGTSNPGDPSVTLTPYETASTLSYALVASAPDTELTEQAAAGLLQTQDELIAQGRRLLAAYPERFARQSERFVREWLSIDLASPAWQKDTEVYPDATPALKAALDKETELFLRNWATSGSYAELLTSPQTFVSKDNAVVYGLSVDSTDFTAVSLDPRERAGILTQPSFLGSRAHSDASSPVMRGTAVMRKFLCREPPPVPAMVPPLPPASESTAKTTRERFEQHTSVEVCASCHGTFDPMGNAFEHYDGMGRYRDEENGAFVDSSGALIGVGDDIPVKDAVELAQVLSTNEEVHACFVRQAYRFTVGRRETEADGCAIQDFAQAFEEQGLNLRELILALVTAPDSLERVPLTPDP